MDYGAKDLIGKTFGHLTVVDFDQTKNGRTYWWCKCDCPAGTIKSIARNNLVCGTTVSCGDSRYHRTEDLVGQVFGRLTVLSRDNIEHRGHDTYWICECSCDDKTIVSVPRHRLLHGDTTSCGCHHREVASRLLTTHGLHSHPLYGVWTDMKYRCNNNNSTYYYRYGGRGIRVCDEWDDFENFYNWAMSNGYEYGLTIERKNNNGDYCPENCAWADRVVQANNRGNSRLIKYGDEEHTIAQWARILGVEYGQLYRSITKGDMHHFESYFDNPNI